MRSPQGLSAVRLKSFTSEDVRKSISILGHKVLETIAYFPLIRHELHRKLHLQQFFVSAQTFIPTWRMPSSDMLRRVALVRTDVSEECSDSIIRVTRIGTANVLPSSPIHVALMMETVRSSETRFLQEPHGVTSQKTAFFIVTSMKTSYV
jgi:hypothetical protein